MEGDREGWEDGARVDEAGYREREREGEGDRRPLTVISGYYSAGDGRQLLQLTFPSSLARG